MSDKREIYGVSLLRNEEHVAAWALGNVVEFCDRLLILDNRSTDRTREIAEALAARHAHVEVIEVADAYDTHRYVEGWAGRKLWVLGVDGDEIYDRAGLARLRKRLLAGAFDDAWRLNGHSLHLVRGDLAGGVGEGFGPPEARSVTKLYNFAAIESWRQGRHERLHGKDMRFRPGWSAAAERNLFAEEPWSGADLRCLHLCFLPRSSLDARGARDNPVEARSRNRRLKPLERFARRLIGLPPDRRANYKRSYYACGPMRRVALDGFGGPADHADVDPAATGAAAAVQDALDGGAAMAAAGLDANIEVS